MRRSSCPDCFALINPEAVDLDEPIILEALVGLVRTAWTSITGVIGNYGMRWDRLQPYILLLFLIILVVGAASTLRKAEGRTDQGSARRTLWADTYQSMSQMDETVEYGSS